MSIGTETTPDATENKDNAFYIVSSSAWAQGGGYFGVGKTLDEARKNWKQAGGKPRDNVVKEHLFTSPLEFAPPERDANKNEADAWIEQDGSLYWIRCEKRTLSNIQKKKSENLPKKKKIIRPKRITRRTK